MKERKQTVVQWSVVNNFSLVIINLHPQEKGQESCVPLQFGLLSGNIFHRIYSRLTSRKASLFESWCLFKRKVCFYHPFWYEERQWLELKYFKKCQNHWKKKKGIRSQGLFPFFNNKMEHPHVKCSLLFLIVLVTSKLAPTKLLGCPKVMWQVTNTT